MVITQSQPPRGPDPARTADHGHPLPARPGDGRRGHGGSLRRPELFHRPHPAAGARVEGPRSPRRGRAPVRLHAGRAPARGAEVGAAAPGRHLLRGLDRKGRRRAARRRRRAPLGRRNWSGSPNWWRRPRRKDRDESPARQHRQGLPHHARSALGAQVLLRRRSAAVRHWVLAVAIACAAVDAGCRRDGAVVVHRAGHVLFSIRRSDRRIGRQHDHRSAAIRLVPQARRRCRRLPTSRRRAGEPAGRHWPDALAGPIWLAGVGHQPFDPARWPGAPGVARVRRAARSSVDAGGPCQRDRRGVRTAPPGRAPAKRSSGAAGHLGTAAAESHSAGGGRATGPTTARASCCATSWRTSGAATGRC